MNYEKRLLFHCHCFLIYLFLYDADKYNAWLLEILDEQHTVL